jgi:L-fucose isomerase-like protein
VESLNPPSVLVIPFSYPDYPPEDIRHQIDVSIAALAEAGLRVLHTPAVAAPDDVAGAVEMLRIGDYDLIVALVVSWVEAPLFVATLREFWHRPMLLWSHTVYYEKGVGLTLGALPAAGVLRETLEEMEAKFAFIYGMPGDEGLMAPVMAFARSAAAVRALSTARVGLLGYASMGMYTGTIDHTQLRRQVGPEIDHLDQYELVVAYDSVREEEVETLLVGAQEWEQSEQVSEADLRKVFRMTLALKKIVREHAWDAVTVKCQYELSRTFGLAPCVPLSILGDEVVASCEGDVPLAVSQLILHYLTGEPTSYGDLHNVTDSNTLWGACGFAPLSYAAGKPIINKHTALYEGLLNSSPYRPGRVTLARLGARRGRFKMHIATGEAVLPPPFHEVGCPTYPFVDVVMDGDPHEFMEEIASQHYAIVYGDVGDELEMLCDILDIEPIMT